MGWKYGSIIKAFGWETTDANEWHLQTSGQYKTPKRKHPRKNAPGGGGGGGEVNNQGCGR